jgi:succinate dehydrogenase/fumarate reductase flavoprotein subunit
MKVIVAEKEPVCGGATAWSGGWMWVPLNPLSQADGIIEDPEQPRMYLKNVLGDKYDEARVDALLEAGPHMVGFFENHTALQFVSGTWIADIQGHVPGAGTGGRSVGPKPYDGLKLGKELRAKLRPQLYETSFLGMGIMAGPDLQAFLHATRSPKAFFHAGWRVAFHTIDMAFHRQGMHLVNGPALIARLMKSADDLGVQLLVSSPATRLLTDGGAVRGAVVDTPNGPVTVRAGRGVVLAAGGFPNDVDRRRELFPRTPTGKEHWTLAPASASGDGIKLGESVGAAFDTSLVSPVAWCPVSLVPYRSGRIGVYPHIVDRGKPGLIAVLGRTLDDLARACGIDPVGLDRTVAQFNRHARDGEDPEFGRGTTPFNRGSGDPDHQPNPSLAPIERGPFYAIKVLPGSFGTFAGLKADPHSRVLKADGEPIPGLYAAGSDQANVMGGHYPSGGINIGPAMTFGYIAGRHAAGATDYENVTPVAHNDGI